jgi:hypothetical protein
VKEDIIHIRNLMNLTQMLTVRKEWEGNK